MRRRSRIASSGSRSPTGRTSAGSTSGGSTCSARSSSGGSTSARPRASTAWRPTIVDGYANRSGFPLRAGDQLRFNRFLARAAHARGLAIGLKNDLEQAAALEPAFDWVLAEQCFFYRECSRLRAFTAAGKAAFVVEYELATEQFCTAARAAGLMAMRKSLALDATREPCW